MLARFCMVQYEPIGCFEHDRSQQHTLPQPRRVHGQHRHGVAPTHHGGGAPLCSRRACLPVSPIVLPVRAKNSSLLSFNPSCSTFLFFLVVCVPLYDAYKIILFLDGVVLFTQVYDWSDFCLSADFLAWEKLAISCSACQRAGWFVSRWLRLVVSRQREIQPVRTASTTCAAWWLMLWRRLEKVWRSLLRHDKRLRTTG